MKTSSAATYFGAKKPAEPCCGGTDYNGFVDAFLSNIQMADPGPTATPAVQNDGGGPGPLVAGAVSIVQGPRWFFPSTTTR